MFKQFKLATKFTLLLSLVLVGAIIISGIVLSKVLEDRAEAEVSDRAQVLMQMVDSARSYTDSHISHLLASKLDEESGFLPEAIPSFAAREIFENLRKTPEYKNYFYKDATLNPTNLRDRADEFETTITKQFQQNRLKTLSGFRNVAGEKLFYSARPLAITLASCLRCHSTPEVAPKSLLATYGAKHGFGWKLDQVLGSQIIYIPASKVFDRAHSSFVLFILIFIFISTGLILLINFLLKWTVIYPIKPMALLAQKIGNDSMGAEQNQEIELKKLAEVAKRSDELGQLGRIFQRMAWEVQMREQSLKQQLQALRIEINQTKRAQQVAEIAETDYFQKLQQEAKNIRNQWQNFEEQAE